MAKAKKPTTDRERLAIVVVHGVGEQGRFEHLEAVAANLKQALAYSDRHPHVELHFADSQTRLSPEQSWRESPATVRWRSPSGRQMEVVFREVHWADLDMPDTWWNWTKLVGWSLGAPGVRIFSQSVAGTPEARGMRAPLRRGLATRLRMRAQLFLVAMVFLLLLATFGVLDWVLKRVSWRVHVFARLRRLIYEYLGDVKLYQDWQIRKDERLEVIGEKSRMAIRRRMVRALVQTAAEVERGEIQGYCVFAHSLGTVVAFNGLMEPDIALPHALTEAEWAGLPPGLKATRKQALPSWLSGSRPPWLDGGAAGKADEVRARDRIDRGRLLAGMRGFLTVGSPLDKFAALWPEIVLINNEDPGCRVPWINVADVQDAVGGKIDLIKPRPGSDSVSGLQPVDDFRWSDQPHLITAHTSYWRAKKRKRDRDRLIDKVIRWVEGDVFVRPAPARANWRSWLGFAFTVVVLITVLLLVFAWLVWAALALVTGLVATDEPGFGSLLSESIGAGSVPGAVVRIALVLLPACAAIILVCSAVRWFWETAKFDWCAKAGASPASGQNTRGKRR